LRRIEKFAENPVWDIVFCPKREEEKAQRRHAREYAPRRFRQRLDALVHVRLASIRFNSISTAYGDGHAVSGPWQAFFKEYDTLFPPTHHAPAIEETGVLGLPCPTSCTTDGNDRWFSKPPPDDTHLPNLPLNADGPRLNPPHGRLSTICGPTQIPLNTDGIVAAIS